MFSWVATGSTVPSSVPSIRRVSIHLGNVLMGELDAEINIALLSGLVRNIATIKITHCV